MSIGSDHAAARASGQRACVDAPGGSIAAFVLLAFALSWTVWGAIIAEEQGILPFPFAVPLAREFGTFGPSLAAVFVVWRFGGIDAARCLITAARQWKVSLRWYAVVVLGPAAISSLALGVHAALGGGISVVTEPQGWFLLPVIAAFVFALGGPLGEEFGWRGYLLPVSQRRYRPWIASLVVGVAWASWHLPLFAIQGTAQQQLPLAVFLVQTTALAFVYSWVFNRTGGNLLLILLLHTFSNTWAGYLGIVPESDASLRPYVIVTVILSGLALLSAVNDSSRGPVPGPDPRE